MRWHRQLLLQPYLQLGLYRLPTCQFPCRDLNDRGQGVRLGVEWSVVGLVARDHHSAARCIMSHGLCWVQPVKTSKHGCAVSLKGHQLKMRPFSTFNQRNEQSKR